MKATKVTAGLAESNGSLLPGLWRDSLHVTCELTACTPRSAPGPTLGNEYGKTLPFTRPMFTKFVYACLYIAVARSSADGVVIYYVLPVSCATSYFHIVGQAEACRYRCSELRHRVVARRLTPLLRRVGWVVF